ANGLFLKMTDPLRSARRLGPILFQLPPAMKCDVALLRSFLELLPGDLRYAFEFRHTSWLVEEVYDALRQRNVALCVAESEKLEVPPVITADFVYYRLRKPEYTADDVAGIVTRSKELLAGGRGLYLMFKHEDSPEGALHAEPGLKGVAAGRTDDHPVSSVNRHPTLLFRARFFGAFSISPVSAAAAAVATIAGLRFAARLFLSASIMSMTGAKCSDGVSTTLRPSILSSIIFFRLSR